MSRTAKKQAPLQTDIGGQPARTLPKANDDMRGGRVPASAMPAPCPANDDEPPRPAADLRLAKPRSGFTGRQEHEEAAARLRQTAEAAANPKLRRFAAAAERRLDLNLPFASRGGIISPEELIVDADLNMRDVAPGTELRKFTDETVQVFVTFPYHLAEGFRTKDPVAGAYAAIALSSRIGRFRDGTSLQWLKDTYGVPVSASKQNPLSKQVMRAAFDDGRARLADEPYSRVASSEDRANLMKAYSATITLFDVPGGKLPSRPERHGVVDTERLALLSGVPTWIADLPECRHHVSKVIRRRGIEVPGREYGVDVLANLVVEVTMRERRRAVLEGLGDPGQHAAALRSTLNKAIGLAGCTTEDPASEVFADDRYPRIRAAVRESYSQASTRRNVTARLDRLKALYDEIIAETDRSQTFAEKLSTLIASEDLSYQDVAGIADCSWGSIRNWCAGKNVGVGSIGAVVRLEDHFGLERGELCSLARKRWREESSGDVNPYWSEVPFSRRTLLPSEVRLLSEDQIREAVNAIEHLARDGTDFARVGNAARSSAYRLPKLQLPKRWIRQKTAYIKYKTSSIVAPMNRPKSGVWREESTVTEKSRELDKMMRFLLAPCTDGANSGLGLDPAKATFAWLAVPGLLLRYFDFEAQHLADVMLEDGERGRLFSSRLKHAAYHLLSLTHEDTGYLTQNPALAEELEVLASTETSARFEGLVVFGDNSGGPLLSQEEIDLARSDWKAFMKVAHVAARQLADFIEADTPTVRDAMRGAVGLIESEEPVANYLGLLIEAETRIRDLRSGIHLATEFRNLVMSHLSIVTGLRPKNLTGLTYGGERPEIFKKDGAWRIVISYRKFKNWQNCGLFGVVGHRLDYSLTIDERFLVKLLDEWFFTHRPELDHHTCDHAFITMSGNAMTSKSWYEAYHRFGARHIAWNPLTQTGFEGVVSLNPYVHRVLKASDILNNSAANDRVQEAAHALQTSEDMIRQHYGLLRSETALRSSYDTYRRAIGIARGKTA